MIPVALTLSTPAVRHHCLRLSHSLFLCEMSRRIVFVCSLNKNVVEIASSHSSLEVGIVTVFIKQNLSIVGSGAGGDVASHTTRTHAD